MNYGLYVSAMGVMSNLYRQDVIANNLANAETVGFKRDLALFQQRRTAAQEMGLPPTASNPLLEALGGGVSASPTAVDLSQGETEPSDSPLDVAIEGRGYFKMIENGQTLFTRNGRFAINRDGHLCMENSERMEILDTKGQPIGIDSSKTIGIDKEGDISADGALVAQIAMVDVPHPELMQKRGGTLLAYPNPEEAAPAAGALHEKFVERSNVDSATELTDLMDAERQLEANANMLRYQDEMMQRLANDVGKIS